MIFAFLRGATFHQTLYRILPAALLAMALIPIGCASKHPAADSSDAPLPLIIRFYQGPLDHLTSVRVGACPMHPNCSEFALAAMERHGFLMGWIMACDRLMRCGGDETHLSPEVLVEGRYRYVDTLDQNDGWWSEPSTYFPMIDNAPPYTSREWGIFIE